MMKALLTLSRSIDAISSFVGKVSAWLILVAVLVSAGNAMSRYALGLASNAWLELQWYLYGTVFLLAASYTLQKNEHVRIDFVSNLLSKRQRDWVDLFGHVFFLLPFTVLITWLAYPWVMKSISSCGEINSPVDILTHLGDLTSRASCEVSASVGGLLIWPAKIMILLGFGLLTLQAISEIIKRIAVIRGDLDDPWRREELPPAVRDMESVMDINTDQSGMTLVDRDTRENRS